MLKCPLIRGQDKNEPEWTIWDEDDVRLLQQIRWDSMHADEGEERWEKCWVLAQSRGRRNEKKK